MTLMQNMVNTTDKSQYPVLDLILHYGIINAMFSQFPYENRELRKITNYDRSIGSKGGTPL